MSTRVMFAVACCLQMVVGCADEPLRHDAGDVGDGGFDAGDSADAGDAAVVSDGSNDTDSGEPTSSCSERFDALDATCTEHSDCVVALELQCSFGGSGRSRALGVARTAHAAALSLATECDLPTPQNAFDSCPGEGGGIAALFTQDQALNTSPAWPYDVRCQNRRCTTLRTTCGTGLCGNGAIDACHWMNSEVGPVFWSEADPAFASSFERCDGDDLNGGSCESQGYGSGVLSCAPNACRYDVSACRTCAPLGGDLRACAEHSIVHQNIESIAVSVRGTDTALLWATYDGVAPRVTLAVYDGDLVQRNLVTLPPDTVGGVYAQLAAYPGGWVLLGVHGEWVGDEHRTYTDLHTFAADGTYEGRKRRMDALDNARLVQRPDGAPLLLYTENITTDPVLRAVALTTDLEFASTPATVGRGTTVTAVHVGDGYLVAYSDDEWLRFSLRRVELDGTVVAQAVAYPQGQGRPVLAFGASRRWLKFIFESQSAMLVEVDGNGAVLDATPRTQLPDALFGASHMVGASDGVYLARSEDQPASGNYVTRVSVVHVGADGVVGTDTQVAGFPAYGIPAAMRPWGEGVVVASMGVNRTIEAVDEGAKVLLSLAHVSP